MKTGTIAHCWILLLFAVFTAPAWSQEDSRRTFEEKVEVDVVNIPVVVTDSGGNPVEGLTAADFVLLQDGKKVKITNFSVVSREAPAGEEISLEFGQTGSEPGKAAAEDELLSISIFVDNLNIHPLRRNMVFRKIREYLAEEMAAGTPVMLASMEGNLQIDQPFTLDHETLNSKLAEMEKRVSGRLFDPSNRDEMKDRINGYIEEITACRSDGRCGPDIVENLVHMMVSETRAYSHAVGWQSEASLYGLQTLCRSLALSPGQKTILYVSDGFSLEPGKELLLELRDKLDRSMRRTVDATSSLGEVADTIGQSENTARGDERYLRIVDSALTDSQVFRLPKVLDEAASTAAADNIRIYSIMAREIASGAPGADVPSELVVAGAEATAMPEIREDWYDRGPLDMMADATGGVSLQGSVKTERLLGQIHKDHRNHYSLGFRTPKARDGEYHEIKVKLKSKKARGRVRHPHGYLAKTDVMRRVDQVVGSLVLGDAGNPHEAAVELGEGEPLEDGQEMVPLKILIPVRHMALLEQGRVHATVMTLAVAVVNDRGRVTILREYPVEVRIPSQHIQDALPQSFPVSLKLAFPPGENTLAVGIWDGNSSVASFLNVEYLNRRE